MENKLKIHKMNSHDVPTAYKLFVETVVALSILVLMNLAKRILVSSIFGFLTQKKFFLIKIKL